jgi:hypothetical protein
MIGLKYKVKVKETKMRTNLEQKTASTFERFRGIVNSDTLRELARKALHRRHTSIEHKDPSPQDKIEPANVRNESDTESHGRHALSSQTEHQITVRELGAPTDWYGTGATRHAKPETTSPHNIHIPDKIPVNPHFLDLGKYTPKPPTTPPHIEAAHRAHEAKQAAKTAQWEEQFSNDDKPSTTKP